MDVQQLQLTGTEIQYLNTSCLMRTSDTEKGSDLLQSKPLSFLLCLAASCLLIFHLPQRRRYYEKPFCSAAECHSQASEFFSRSNICFICGMQSSTTVTAPSAAMYVKLYHTDHVTALNPSGAYSPKKIIPESTAHI